MINIDKSNQRFFKTSKSCESDNNWKAYNAKERL